MVGWHHFYSPCALSSHPNFNPNLNQYHESYPTPNLITNPKPTEKWGLFSRWAEHCSRDHLKRSFSPITPHGCIFTSRHGVDSESASKNTPNPIFQYPKYWKIKSFLATNLIPAIYRYPNRFIIGWGGSKTLHYSPVTVRCFLVNGPGLLFNKWSYFPYESV